MPAANRVDFAIGPEARRARCRYCLQTIYWAPDVHRGPLHAASAIKNGDGEVRMESHVAHCAQRETALAKAKTQACPGRGCKKRIELGDAAPLLCPTCWELLPDTIRGWVVREGRRSPRTKAFDEAVDHARRIVGRIRERVAAGRPRPAPTLFPGVEYG